MTYLEFCQDLTRPSDCLTTPQRCVSSLKFPAQQSVVLGGVFCLIGGISRLDNMNFMSWLLKSSGSWMLFRWCGILFHNIGPIMANDWSNRVWLAAELDWLLEGMTAKFPRLGRETNWMLRSLLVLPWRTFHIWRRMNRLRLHWRDMSDRWAKRSQECRCFTPAVLDVKVFCILSGSWMSLIFVEWTAIFHDCSKC